MFNLPCCFLFCPQNTPGLLFFQQKIRNPESLRKQGPSRQGPLLPPLWLLIPCAFLCLLLPYGLWLTAYGFFALCLVHLCSYVLCTYALMPCALMLLCLCGLIFNQNWRRLRPILRIFQKIFTPFLTAGYEWRATGHGPHFRLKRAGSSHYGGPLFRLPAEETAKKKLEYGSLSLMTHNLCLIAYVVVQLFPGPRRWVAASSAAWGWPVDYYADRNI